MPKKEKEELPPRKTVIFGDGFIAETILTEQGPRFCVYDKKSGGILHQKTLVIKSIEYVPLYKNDSLIGFVTFPTGTEEYGDDNELFASVRSFINKWCEMEPRYEQLAALYAMYTWAYDEFLECPYLRILADLGSGKSRLGVSVLGSICYKAFKTIGASTMSPLFRTLDFLGGTLVLDEADLGDQSDKTSEMVQMLNTGYIKGVPIMRSELGAGGFRVAKYSVFGPKIIISREHFKDNALESRCLVVKLGRSQRSDIPFLIDETLEAEASVLRNKLLLWRLRGYGTRRAAIDYSFAALDVPPRLKQLLLLVSGIINNEEMKAVLRVLAQEFAAEHIEQRSGSIEGELAEILCAFPAGSFLSCTEIAEKFNETRTLPSEKKTPRSIGWFLRERLGLRTWRYELDRRRGLSLTEKQRNELIEKFSADSLPLPPPWLPAGLMEDL